MSGRPPLQPTRVLTDISHARHEHGAGHWVVMALAIVVALLGAVLLAGGSYLITLGGSWYYGLAGLGLLVTAFYLFTRSMAALWVYLLVWACTVAWAFWEVGTDWWAQVPRLIAPTVILLAVLLAIPALGRRERTQAVTL